MNDFHQVLYNRLKNPKNLEEIAFHIHQLEIAMKLINLSDENLLKYAKWWKYYSNLYDDTLFLYGDGSQKPIGILGE